MRIQHNIAALNSYRNLTNNNSAVSKNLEKLSSGYRINRAGDDAAGLAISEKMRAQITGLETAQKNANDGISLVQTAEGALTEVHSMLNRMVELAEQSANGTYQDSVDRENLQKEVTSLKDEIDRISESTNFNGIQLLDGSLDGKGLAGATFTGAGSAATITQTATGAAGVVQEYEIDLTGIKVDTAGQAKVTIGSAVFSIEVTEADSAESIAQKVAAAYNGLAADSKIKDGTDGAVAESYYIATSQGSKVVLTANASGTATAIKGAIAFADDAKAATGTDLTLQIGDSAASYNQMTVSVQSMDTTSLGINNVDISTQYGAKAAIDVIKNAINKVSSTRGDLGAVQNRLEHTINNLSVTTENMTSAESRIRDTDIAEEMMAYTKNNILVQSSQAMLAQANQIPQGVLQLLQ